MVLGGTIFNRTYSADSNLAGAVASSWGTKLSQPAPTAAYWKNQLVTEQVQRDGQTYKQQVNKLVPVYLPLDSTRVNVVLNLDHRQKGLLWYSTYAVDFSGAYKFRNTSASNESVDLQLKFPAAQAVYDNLTVTIDDKPVPIRTDSGGVAVTVPLVAGQTAAVTFSYRSQGMES